MTDLWDITLRRLREDEESNDCGEFSLPYQELGDPARPLEFPTSTILDCELTTVLALDHRTNLPRLVDNVLIRTERQRRFHRAAPPDRAYLVRKKLSKSIYGCVRVCLVLKRRTDIHVDEYKEDDYSNEYLHRSNDSGEHQEPVWVSTDEYVVVKISSLNKIRDKRGKEQLEDPVREVAALQLVGNHHPHVLGCLECLQDDRNLYVIMPYGGPMNLHTKLFAMPTTTHHHHNNNDATPADNKEEAKARGIFRQLLLGMFHLQQKGICHRDLALDNLMMDDQGRLRIFDLGMSLRVPYTDPLNPHGVTDVSEGLCRRLMKVSEQGGRVMYLAPEIVSQQQGVIDGFATDLWSAGVILFVLLVGMAPFKYAQSTDKRYAKISKGKLKDLLTTLNISMSEEACELLQHMFRRDPKDRLTLVEVMRHPWVLGERFVEPSPENIPRKVIQITESSESSVSSAAEESTEERTPSAAAVKDPKVQTRKLNLKVLKTAVRPEARQTASSGQRNDNRSSACSASSASSGSSSVEGPSSHMPVPVMDQQGLAATIQTRTSQDTEESKSPRNFKGMSPHRVKVFLGNFKAATDKAKKAMHVPKL